MNTLSKARTAENVGTEARKREAVLQQEEEGLSVRYDLSPALVEGKVRDKLIKMGWTPPGKPESVVLALNARLVRILGNIYRADASGNNEANIAADRVFILPDMGGEYVRKADYDELVELVEAFQSYLQDDSRSPRRRQACLQGCAEALAKVKP